MHSVVVAAGLEKFVLTGSSGGAPVSLAYAAEHPENVCCLVITGGFMKGALKRGVDPSYVDAFGRLIEEGWGGKNPAFRQMMSTQLFPSATQNQLRAFDILQQKAADGRTAANLMNNLAKVDVSSLLPRIKAPTLIFHSDQDARQPFEQAVKMAELIPNAELHVLDSDNHAPLEHEPIFESYCRLTVDFINRHCQ